MGVFRPDGFRVAVVLAASVLQVVVATTWRDGSNMPPRKAALVLRRRWDYNTAREETRTEWGIVMRRYQMVDVELSSMFVRLSELVSDQAGDFEGTIAELSPKVARLTSNLEAAQKDVEVSDNTFRSMQVDQNLTAVEQDVLSKKHADDKGSIQELSNEGARAAGAAQAFLKELHREQQERSQQQNQQVRGSGKIVRSGRVSANAAADDGETAVGKSRGSDLRGALRAFEAAAAAFHARRTALEQSGR